jgi:Uma2 family endonuclease
MAQTTARPLTKYDYWELPEAGPRYQLINGDLFMAPAPNRFHQDISRTIQFELMKYLEAEPIGILYNAPFDVVLTDINVFQPDLAFFSERRRRFLTEKGAEGAPDLVVEILSRKTAHLDHKRLVYARTGVDELWVVDPNEEEVRVYLFREDPDLPKVILRSGDLLKTSRLSSFPFKRSSSDFDHPWSQISENQGAICDSAVQRGGRQRNVGSLFQKQASCKCMTRLTVLYLAPDGGCPLDFAPREIYRAWIQTMNNASKGADTYS